MTFDAILKFERELSEFTGAPFAIMTDCCTHAIELCLRYDKVDHCSITPYTYISVPMTMHKLGISYSYLAEIKQTWVGEYHLYGTRVWDSARRLERNMYRKGMMQCLSFGNGKPLQVGRGGAILLDDDDAYEKIIRQRYDGRNLQISPWPAQKVFNVGYHYRPTIEEAVAASTQLSVYKESPKEPVFVEYPDIRDIIILD